VGEKKKNNNNESAKLRKNRKVFDNHNAQVNTFSWRNPRGWVTLFVASDLC
jgi:phage-related protein